VSPDYSKGAYDEYDHGDYMGKEEFFTNIHGSDIAVSKDGLLSKHKGMADLKVVAENGW
jgi:hypothetical protein